MPKIVSRQDTETARVTALQDALVHFSMGTVSRDGKTGIVQVGDDIDTLVSQTTSVMASMVQTLEHVAVDLAVARTEATQYSLRVDELESIVENLLADVSYDEALDHATADLMDCFVSRGADVTADGKLEFDERTIFSKEDIKPMLREAIVRWIELKLEQ